jgi:glycosyltransferase involved in cell wall biosynthesis
MKLCHLTINPIDYERRIFNQIETAVRNGYTVYVFALGRPGEPDRESRYTRSGYTRNGYTYFLERIRTVFYRGGPLKFISYNLQLLFKLLRGKFDLLHCHDLWVLPAAAAAAWIKGLPLIYDAHEYYAGLEIFRRKRISRFCWLLAERMLIRRAHVVLTVSEKLGERFRDRYPGLPRIEIIRNLPRFEHINPAQKPIFNRVPTDRVLVYHGHFKPGRGLENLIHAVGLTTGVQLWMIGNGEHEAVLKHIVHAENLKDRVHFHDFIPTSELISTSAQGDIGVVLFEPSSLNYAAALPNKFFEYAMAGLAVLCSEIETFRQYLAAYDFGVTVDPADIQAISRTITAMTADSNRLKLWKSNALKAAAELNWEKEEGKLVQIYASLQA